jgi:hypothetical protein
LEALEVEEVDCGFIGAIERRLLREFGFWGAKFWRDFGFWTSKATSAFNFQFECGQPRCMLEGSSAVTTVPTRPQSSGEGSNQTSFTISVFSEWEKPTPRANA